jgi:pimeloyl-ACP methyl ester carboxylesterase
MSKTIMLIHGAWLNAHSWEGFKARYEARGYAVVAPSWPLDDRSPAELRASRTPLSPRSASTSSSITTIASFARCPSRRS